MVEGGVPESLSAHGSHISTVIRCTIPTVSLASLFVRLLRDPLMLDNSLAQQYFSCHVGRPGWTLSGAASPWAGRLGQARPGSSPSTWDGDSGHITQPP